MPKGRTREAPESRGEWGELPRSSTTFEKYYNEVYQDKEELGKMVEALQRDLPTTFRVIKEGNERWEEVLHGLERAVAGMGEEVPEAKRPERLPWYPGGCLCWSVKMTKKEMSKEYPSARRFYDLLVKETDRGAIVRQEAVSMIPPLFLDVQTSTSVLDMCAAPGSKTTQLMEMLYGGQGHVVANDADIKRCDVLVKRVQRLPGSMNMSCVVTNHDASKFPKTQLFDRVLADVVCSGDGTLRKNPTLWTKWKPTLGMSQHLLQISILKRGMDLLKPGGRLVYSTCSFNPIENEAVIAHCINTSPCDWEILHLPDKLPLLQRSPGITSWKVPLPDMSSSYSTFADIPRETQLKYGSLKASMFPPERMAKGCDLTHTMRFRPEAMDTGGFFVAVLHRKSETGKEEEACDESVASNVGFTMSKVGTEEQKVLAASFKARESFPTDLCYQRVIDGAGGRSKRVFMVSPEVASVLHASPSLRVVSAGLRVAEKVNSSTYRPTQTAADILSQHVPMEEVPMSVFIELLSSRTQPWTATLPGLLAAAADSMTYLIAANKASHQITAACKKSGSTIQLWGDAIEADRLRVALGIEHSETPVMKPPKVPRTE